MTQSPRRLVVATRTTTWVDGGDRVLRLVRWLREDGVGVEVLSLAGGDELPEFERVAPTAVVRQLRGAGVQLASAVGGARLRQAVRGRALRRWLGTRAGAAVLVAHPEAASVLRYRPPGGPVVAMLPTPAWTLAALRPADRASLAPAAGWLVCTAAQVAEVDRELGRPAVVTGPLLHAAELPAVTRSADGAVVVLPSPDSWDSINHTVELLRGLADACPHELRWVVPSEQDRWLAEHDLRHAALDARVRLVRADDPDVMSSCSLVVRSGYGGFSSPIVVAAGDEGVPVAGFGADTSRGLASPVFDVEHVVAQVLDLLEAMDQGRATPSERAAIDPDPRDVVAQVLDWSGAGRTSGLSGT